MSERNQQLRAAQLRNVGRRMQERWRLFRARHPYAITTLKRALLAGAIVGGVALRTRTLGRLSTAAGRAARAAPRSLRGPLRAQARVARQSFQRWRLGAFLGGGAAVPYVATPALRYRGALYQQRKARKEHAAHPILVLTRRGGHIVHSRYL